MFYVQSPLKPVPLGLPPAADPGVRFFLVLEPGPAYLFGVRNTNTRGYGEDLAYVHNAGFGFLAACAAAELLTRLKAGESSRSTRRVVDLGCGSGILARQLVDAGYDVLGFDLSAPMVRLARRHVPSARFVVRSCVTTRLPRCVAVTAVGEVLNYMFDRGVSIASFERVVRRVYTALVPGGLFLFDVAAPGRAGETGVSRGFATGDDWACLFAAEQDPSASVLTRTITTFVKMGSLYRRKDETHRLRLYSPDAVERVLRSSGFQLQRLRRYAEYEFTPGWVAFLARKAAPRRP